MIAWHGFATCIVLDNHDINVPWSTAGTGAFRHLWAGWNPV